MCPYLSANYVSDCPPNMAQVSVWPDNLHSNGLNRDTTLKVVVYQYWNIDQLVSEIEEKHNKLNGTPTILTVELYPSKWFFQNGYGPFYTTTIHYH